MPINALLESVQDVDSERHERHHGDALMEAILDHLNEQSVISLDSLVCLMPQYTWNQIFHHVDQLARCHRIVLRRHRFEYMLFSPQFVA
jgi:hypothetical protein